MRQPNTFIRKMKEGPCEYIQWYHGEMPLRLSDMYNLLILILYAVFLLFNTYKPIQTYIEFCHTGHTMNTAKIKCIESDRNYFRVLADA
jgi:hypothetical protein